MPYGSLSGDRHDLGFYRHDWRMVDHIVVVMWCVFSLQLFARYFEYRQRNPNLFRNFSASEPDIRDALFDGFPGEFLLIFMTKRVDLRALLL